MDTKYIKITLLRFNSDEIWKQIANQVISKNMHKFNIAHIWRGCIF